MHVKKGTMKGLVAKANKPKEYKYATKSTGRLRIKRKPLKFNYIPTNTVPSLNDTGYKGVALEDKTLTEAKNKLKTKAVQLYNKGPYGLLTDTLAKEMAHGENRRRS